MYSIACMNSTADILSCNIAMHQKINKTRSSNSGSQSFADKTLDESRSSDDSRKAFLIRSLSRHGNPFAALDQFRELLSNGLRNPATLPLCSVLHCCHLLNAINCGREVHGFLVRNGVNNSGVRRAQSALVHFYANSGLLSHARKVFDGMPEKDVVSWTIILMAYAKVVGLEGELMRLFLAMLWSGERPNRYTLTVMLGSSSLIEGQQLQGFVVKRGWDSDGFIGTALVDMYAKNRELYHARLAFDRIKSKDVVCFNSLISGFGRMGHVENFIAVFEEMCATTLIPNHSTLVSLLNCCAGFGILALSNQFHGQLVVRGFSSDEALSAIIIDMYSKCGDLESAHAAFDHVGAGKCLALWNSMICGYGKHGCAVEALEAFSSMQQASFLPDHITFTCLLSACSHSGLVKEGWSLFNSMNKVYGVPPRNEHYGCMVDLLCRAGRVRDAYEFIKKNRVESVASVWGALLAACKVWGVVDIGEIAARKLFEIEPKSSGPYVELNGILSMNERWVDAVKIRRMMDKYGIKKEPGYSWIGVGGVLHRFRAGDGDIADCVEMAQILSLCRDLNSNLLGNTSEMVSFED
ncbi:hypothetical protein HPP92_018714 [Vanilla planifolia]|uniref:Pentatricopeptide repeat-containing protein n=1 Tax=Vanilla planifolia TaxID=51239 RepID=A0A835QAB1_VANPL|nr:hypothetical protein HPP92_018714 [Vanilla planifolia]